MSLNIIKTGLKIDKAAHTEFQRSEINADEEWIQTQPKFWTFSAGSP